MLVARRTAFSAFGQVLTIGGRPLTNGTVIATRMDTIQHQEQALLERDGTFRVMNLTPGGTYRLILESFLVLRQLPEELTVTIPSYQDDADVFGLKIFVFERPTTIVIEGSIKCDDPLLADSGDVRLELFYTDDLDRPNS